MNGTTRKITIPHANGTGYCFASFFVISLRGVKLYPVRLVQLVRSKCRYHVAMSGTLPVLRSESSTAAIIEMEAMDVVGVWTFVADQSMGAACLNFLTGRRHCLFDIRVWGHVAVKVAARVVTRE